MNPLLHEFPCTRYSSSSEYCSAHSTILQSHLQVFSTPENFPDLTVSYGFYASKQTTRYFQLQTCKAICIKYQLSLCLDLSQTRRTTVMVLHVEGMNFMHPYAGWINKGNLETLMLQPNVLGAHNPCSLTERTKKYKIVFKGSRTSICMPANNTQHQGLF